MIKFTDDQKLSMLRMWREHKRRSAKETSSFAALVKQLALLPGSDDLPLLFHKPGLSQESCIPGAAEVRSASEGSCDAVLRDGGEQARDPRGTYLGHQASARCDYL